MDNIDVVNSKNFSIPEVAVVVIVMVFEEHDITMGRPRIYDILIPPNIVCSVVESHNVVVIDPITFKKN
jgi:hypothetical protein